MGEYEMQLVREAGAVSLSILPLYLTFDALLPIKNDKWRTILAVMLSGGSLHVIAEYSGLNQWYLEHSAISIKMRPITAINDDNTVNYQNGACGATSCPITNEQMDAL